MAKVSSNDDHPCNPFFTKNHHSCNRTTLLDDDILNKFIWYIMIFFWCMVSYVLVTRSANKIDIYICIYNTLADMISMLEEPIYPNTFFAGILNQATQRLLNNRSASKLQTPFTTWTGRNCSQKTLPWLGPGVIFWGLEPANSRNILKRSSFHKSENVTMIILSVLLSIWRIFLFNQSESCLGYSYRWNDHKCSYLSQQLI